jgi:hypothetical protein
MNTMTDPTLHIAETETYPPGTNLEAVRAKNRGYLKATGEEFYIGAFDALDGHVLEVRSYQATGCMTRHHNEYLSRKVAAAVNKGEAGLFFVHQNGFVYTQWRLRDGDFGSGALDNLSRQILVDGRPPRIFEEVGRTAGGFLQREHRASLSQGEPEFQPKVEDFDEDSHSPTFRSP